MCSRRILGLVAGFALLALAITSFAVYVSFTYSGGVLTLQPMETVVLSEGYSSFWCEGLFIESEDPLLHFNASVVSGDPQFDSSNRQKSSSSLVVPVAKRESVQLSFYLPSTSKLYISHCASEPYLASYIFESGKIDQECYDGIIGSFYYPIHDYECADVVREEKVNQCDEVSNYVKVQSYDDEYYKLVYKNPSQFDAEVKVVLTLSQPWFDLPERKAFCYHKFFCYLPFDWSSQESVVIQSGVEGSKLSQIVYYDCQPNYLVYALLFGVLPLTVLLSIAAVACCCARRRKRKDAAAVSESIEHKRLSDTEALLPSPKAYGTFDSGDVTMDPLPGPSLLPSAPPVTAPPAAVPNNEEFVIHEPPPTYEESMKVDKETNMKT